MYGNNKYDMTITMILIAIRKMKSERLVNQSIPSMARLEILITINSIGSKTGKLNMAIRAELFDALDAIPLVMVKMLEKPNAPSRIVNKYNPISCTGLPRTSE